MFQLREIEVQKKRNSKCLLTKTIHNRKANADIVTAFQTNRSEKCQDPHGVTHGKNDL